MECIKTRGGEGEKEGGEGDDDELKGGVAVARGCEPPKVPAPLSACCWCLNPPTSACPVTWWAHQATMPPPFLPCLSEVHLFGTAGGAKAIAHNSRAWRCTATVIAIPLMRSQRTKVVTSTLMCIWIPGWCVIVGELK